MTRPVQALMLTLTGAVLVRMATGDAYLNYVNSWMRWPLIVCGLLLLGLAISDLWPSCEDDAGHDEQHGGHAEGGDDGDHVPRTAWLLFVPSVVVFLIAPPALGAYFAERAQTTTVTAESASEVAIAPLPITDPAPLALDEVVVRAAYDEGATLADRRLELTGFVSRDPSGTWYVTQFGINCCAADATVTKVIATGYDAPPDDQWVKVVGTHVEGTGAGGSTVPEVTVEELELIDAPTNEYQ